MANYRLTRRTAERVGRIHEVRFRRRGGADGGGWSLIVANGPSALTISELHLQVRFQMPKESFFSSVRVHVDVHPREFARLGITGPEIPHRIDSFDQCVWHLPGTGGLPDRTNVEFRWLGRTAQGDAFASPLGRAGHFEGVHWFGRTYHVAVVDDSPILQDERFRMVMDMFDRQKSQQLSVGDPAA
ncbi:hypothetical protein [Actinoplanes sp. NPDC048796]|uniref:hypothetical protein n=1 Tax=Actinoplanes sp. NPDC048796 TaxID=3155640 RepID=UPI0033E7D3FD